MVATPKNIDHRNPAAIAMGAVVRSLRERIDMSVVDAAAELKVTRQAWANYEAGVRDKILRSDLQEAIAGVLGVEVEDLIRERNRLAGAFGQASGVSEPARQFIFDVFGRARAGPQGPEVYDVGEPLRRIDLGQMLGRNTGAMEVAGDSMVPWAEPGEVVLFDRDRYPKRGAGCVIETHGGEAYVKLYEKSDGSTLFVRELFPEERTVTFALRDVRGVYGIRLRGD